jgi:RNA polymerase sigma-70 factor (ECF subfamily)
MPQAARMPLPETMAEVPDLRQIYEAHAEHIESMVRRLLGPWGDADDLVQEVFVVAWQKRRRVPANAMRQYLSAIAIRVISDARRRERVRRLCGLQVQSPCFEWRTPERALEQAEANRLVYAVLETVAAKKRTVFILHELQGLTGSEIASLLGCPLKTVWTRLHYARREVFPKLQALVAGGDWKGRR